MKKIAAKNGMLLNNPNILSFPQKILFWGTRGESFYKCLTETIETFGGGGGGGAGRGASLKLLP